MIGIIESYRQIRREALLILANRTVNVGVRPLRSTLPMMVLQNQGSPGQIEIRPASAQSRNRPCFPGLRRLPSRRKIRPCQFPHRNRYCVLIHYHDLWFVRTIFLTLPDYPGFSSWVSHRGSDSGPSVVRLSLGWPPWRDRHSGGIEEGNREVRAHPGGIDREHLLMPKVSRKLKIWSGLELGRREREESKTSRALVPETRDPHATNRRSIRDVR